MTNTRYNVDAIDFPPADLHVVIDDLYMAVEEIAMHKGDICLDLVGESDPETPWIEKRAHIIYNVGTCGPDLDHLNDVRRAFGFDPVSIHDLEWHDEGRNPLAG